VVEYRKVENCSRPLVVGIEEKLVIRVWRWDEARSLKDATDGFEIETAIKGEEPRYYSVSVFALARRQGETIDVLIDRLTLHAADHRRFQWYCLVTESELVDAKFELIRNEPPDDHYDIPLGTGAVDPDRVSKLAQLFGDEKIRMRT
jgi:hypothetical protein